MWAGGVVLLGLMLIVSAGIPQDVGQEPHGLAVWPQPGRYSLGHTGNMR